MVALHVRELSSRLPPLTPLNRGQWDQGDTLGRGQWLFTLAHELAHKVLTDDAVRTEWDVAYDVLAQAAIDEVASLTSDRADGGVDPPRDEFRIGPFLSLWNTILTGPDGRFVDQGPVDHAGFLRAKMYDPPTREEMLCDFYAAIAVRSVMARYTIPPIALATCALAIAGLGLLQYLDAAAREAPSANAKLSDAITRLFMLRGSLCALLRSEGASEETVREASRAMGDVVRVFGETFLVPLYINWALLPAMLFEDAATVAQSIWFGDDRDRLHSLFLQRPRSRRP